MDIYRKKQLWKSLLLAAAILIGFTSLWYTNKLVDNIRTEERRKMELWTRAYEIILSTDNESLNFPLSVIQNNSNIPVLITDEQGGILFHRNFDSLKVEKEDYLKRQLRYAREENDSLVIDLGNEQYQYMYYRNSIILKKLKFFPYVQLGVIILFILVSYIAFNISRKAEQNEVWTGLSKETAHQLGTPISSLLGWMEILKQSGAEPETVAELKKDAGRLEKITDRFSKIGSKPTLHESNLKQLLQNSLDYIRTRGSKEIHFELVFPDKEILLPLSETLFEWVIENLCKNAMDAIGGEGTVRIKVSESASHLFIDVEDTGKGIPKNRYRTIFKPGYTTKKRGWGLGLSLSKRIVETYHNGKIFVLSSEPNHLTIIRIALRRAM
ncbi:MAG: HAMP domain-containing histidine kinase [Bacteroidales bacterium]|nr:HAMP domain-containing histidine kinase [Bacteroidales bacterium]MBN2697817.1 HAMP domain-containing histidine kinase [Bacteroidales bacterium]